MTIKSGRTIRWILAAFGIVFLGLGLWLLLDDSPQRDVARAEALPVIDASTVGLQAAGTAVLLTGHLAAVGPVGREGFLAYEHEQYRGTEQSGASKGRARWMQLSDETPPVAIESGGSRVTVVNSGYGLRGEPHQWQSSEVLYYSSVGDSTEHLRGFKAGDFVMVDGRIVEGPAPEAGARPLAFEATVLFGGDRAAYLESLRSGIVAARIVGAVFAGLGALVLAVSTWIWRRTRTAAAMLIACGFISSLALPAARAAEKPKGFDEEIARKYASVAGWQGFWESSETRAFSKSNAMGHTRKAYEAVSHGRFELTRNRQGWAPEHGDFRWTGSGDASGTTSESYSSWSKSGPRMTGEDFQISGGGHGSSSRVEFTLWMGRQHASLHAGTGTADVAPTHKVGHGVRQLSSADGQYHYEEVTIDETWSAPIMQFVIPNYEKETKNWVVAQGGPGVLAFEREERHHASVGGLRRSRVVMVPVYDDIEVEVTIEGYADWRPQGSIADPTKPGNALAARAVLKSKGGKTKDLPEVERFRFELIDTSREPGVCLNWPLAAKDENYDLEFADLSAGGGAEQLAAVQKFFADWGLTSSGDYDLANMPAGGVPRFSFAEVSEEGQRAELIEPPKDATGQPFAEAAIECFDFGAKAELRVTCILKDGRELLGLMKGEDGEQDLVRLPKRAGPDWVAERWRKDNDAMNLGAMHDNEKVEGQDHNGDGFTLYEEYRGWVENGKHLEGDPKAKDFFVLNDIGADAVGGFRLFQRESRIKVHHRLTKREMSTDERLMNGNHRDAPHRVDQHGVWIFNAWGTGIPDAGTTGLTSDDTSYAFRPGRVRYVTVEPRNLRDATFSAAAGLKYYNLTERDAAFGYDRAVAHELLHAVGVDHHGEGETAHGYYFQSASDPNNASHHVGFTTTLPHTSDVDLGKGPGYRFTGTELARMPPVTFLWEDTGRDVAEELAPIYERKLAAERARRAANPPAPADDPGRWATQFPAYRKSAEYWRDSAVFDSVAYDGNEFELHVTISKRGEADSGNEGCLMRYYFANAYPAEKQANTFYLVRPGANHAGRSICRTPEGTGANAPSHKPQSRFGDSSPGRGGCFAQICPNDDIPPRKL